MTHYAWTIKTHGRQDIEKVTTLPELYDILQMLKLPGTAPPHWLTIDPWHDKIPGHGHYAHNEGRSDEWSLIWTKVDYGPGDGT